MEGNLELTHDVIASSLNGWEARGWAGFVGRKGEWTVGGGSRGQRAMLGSVTGFWGKAGCSQGQRLAVVACAVAGNVVTI